MRSRLLIVLLVAGRFRLHQRTQALSFWPPIPPPRRRRALPPSTTSSSPPPGRRPRMRASSSIASAPTCWPSPASRSLSEEDHEIGRIERAKDGNPGDPAKDFTAVDLTIYDSGQAFTKAVCKRGKPCPGLHPRLQHRHRRWRLSPDPDRAGHEIPRHAGALLMGLRRQDARLRLRQGLAAPPPATTSRRRW